MKEIKKLKIGIVGLGLIGGSLALKLAAEGFRVIGIDRPPSPLKGELKYPLTPLAGGIIRTLAPSAKSLTSGIPKQESGEVFAFSNGEATSSLFETISDKLEDLNSCDMVFLCTPLNALEQTLKNIQPHLKPGAIVTDVGSVKSFICKAAQESMREDCYFIGGHPMAGTEKSGFENAFPELFEGRPWALMETENKEQLEILQKIVCETGAKLILADPEEHDKAVALISHLPLLLSMSLLRTVEELKDKKLKELALSLASSGFESMTRLARGNQELNRDLLKFNERNVEYFAKQLKLEMRD